MITTDLGLFLMLSSLKVRRIDDVKEPSRFWTQHPVSGVASNALAVSGKMSSSIETSLDVSWLLSFKAIIWVGRSCILTTTQFSSLSTAPSPRDFEILSLCCKRSSGVVPALGVRAIPVRTGVVYSTPLPGGKTLFTVFTIYRECAARRGESSGSLTNTLLVGVGFFFGSVRAGLAGRLAGRLGGAGVPTVSA